METIKLKTHIGKDGILKLETATNLKDIEAEVLIVLQAKPEEKTDDLGWTIGYFEAIDAIEADDLIERPDQGLLEERETLE